MDGLTITIGGAGLVAIGGVLVKVLDEIVYSRKRGTNGNGYVKMTECDKQQIRMSARFDRIDTQIDRLNKGVTDACEKVAEMRGYLEAHLN